MTQAEDEEALGLATQVGDEYDWWAFGDPATGRLDGTIRRLRTDQVEANTPPGMVAVRGEYDPERSMLVMGDEPSVVPCRPWKPQDTPLVAHVWSEERDEWVAQPTEQMLARDVRVERDRLLSACDWVTLRAYRSGAPVPSDWAAYMQALADITEQPGFPHSVEWPVAPG